MATSAYSQVGYPKIIKFRSDSVVAITFEQMRRINIVKAERDSYKEISDSLFSQVELYEEEKKIGFNMLENCNSRLILKDTIIIKEQEINLILSNENKRLTKQIKKEKTIKTVMYAVGGFFVAALSGVAIYLGVK
jgi:hypothetical protein